MGTCSREGDGTWCMVHVVGAVLYGVKWMRACVLMAGAWAGGCDIAPGLGQQGSNVSPEVGHTHVPMQCVHAWSAALDPTAATSFCC